MTTDFPQFSGDIAPKRATSMNSTHIAGIDVSHSQGGGIVWKEVAASGRKFAILKATQGGTFTDPMFAHNRVGAAAAGLLMGAYHFYSVAANWSDQAHHFCQIVGSLGDNELPPVLDIEDRQGVEGANLTDVHRQLLAWLEAVHAKLGKLPIVYCDPDFAKNDLQDLGFAKYPLWIAGYQSSVPTNVKPWSHASFWQYSDAGTVPGVYGACDLDYYLGTIDQLKGLTAKS